MDAGELGDLAADLPGWRGAGSDPMALGGANPAMHIVWLKTELLHPIDKGGRIRTYQMLRHLKRTHRITYVTLDDGSADADARERAAEYCHDLKTVAFRSEVKRSLGFYRELLGNLLSPLPYAIAKYRVPAFTEAIRAVARDADVVVCDFLFPAVNVPADLGPAVVLFEHNVEAQIWQRHAEHARGPLARAYMSEQWRRMRNFEGRECARFDHVIAVSQEDAQRLKQEYALGDVSAVPTGVDTEYFAATGTVARSSNELVFTGSMDWLPNEDAMTWFVADVLPRIRARVPDVTLAIVGRTPSTVVRALGETSPNVTVTGSVPDVRPYLERGALFVIPLRIGGGTRLKVFEAMAMGIPVVSTRVGVEGLPLHAESEYVAADDAEGFADAVVRLLQAPARAATIASTALARVRSEFGWAEVARRFGEICAQSAGTRKHVRGRVA
ncbi:MAG: glycosyltransferase [Gemmatimonadaceae bacterium]